MASWIGQRIQTYPRGDICYSHMLYCMALTTSELEFLSQEVRRVLKPGGLNYKEIRVLNIEMIARIRNQATHYKKAISLEKSDALLLHGFLLKLLTITGLLDAEGKGKKTDAGRLTYHKKATRPTNKYNRERPNGECW
jgi:hypothetical protein